MHSGYGCVIMIDMKDVLSNGYTFTQILEYAVDIDIANLPLVMLGPCQHMFIPTGWAHFVVVIGAPDGET